MALPPIGIRSRQPIVSAQVDAPAPRSTPAPKERDVFERGGASAPASVPANAQLDDAIATALELFNGFTPDEGRDTPTGIRGGAGGEVKRNGRSTPLEVQGEARTRTSQRVEKEDGQDVYRQSQEAKVVAGGKVRVRGRVELGTEEEKTRSVDVELRVPAGTPRHEVPTNHSALNDPLRLPDGGELRIKGTTTGKSQDGVELPIGAVGVGFDGSREQATSTELRVRRDGNFAEVTRIDETKVTGVNRAGVSVGAVKRLGGVTVAEAKGGSERTFSDRTEKTVRFDLSTAEGRVAYQKFLTTKDVPATASPGVEPLGEKQVLRSTAGQVGSVEGHTPIESHKLEGRTPAEVVELIRSRGPDGKVETTRRVTGADGTEVRSSGGRHDVKLPKPDADALKLLDAAFPGAVKRDADGNVTLQLSDAQVQQLGHDMFPFTRGQTPKPSAEQYAVLMARLRPAEFAAKALQGQDARAAGVND